MDKVTIPDVMTLEQTSVYLQLSIETVLDQAVKGNIPGRKIVNDWRFLKSAIDEWLSAKSSSSILLAQAGAFIDDDSSNFSNEEFTPFSSNSWCETRELGRSIVNTQR